MRRRAARDPGNAVQRAGEFHACRLELENELRKILVLHFFQTQFVRLDARLSLRFR